MDKNMYDNSKDALAAIIRKHGVEELLGSRLKYLLNDYAPGIKKSRKNVISLVVESGAAEILKRSIGAGAGEQEIAFRQAVQKVVEEYATERSEAESVMLEFTAALGWKVNIQPTSPDPKETQNPSTSKNQQIQPKPAQQNLPTPVQATGNLTPGQRNVPFGKYLWRVLDVQNGRALLLAEEVLEWRRYHSDYIGVTWENCELRSYLNGEFFRTFSSQEQERIAQTENANKDNQWYGTPGGRSTVDRVFLLSIEEVVKYFGDSGQLRKRPEGKDWIADQYNSARIAKYRGETVLWWLRSPGYFDIRAASVLYDGNLYMDGDDVNHEEGGVRPALWLNL